MTSAVRFRALITGLMIACVAGGVWAAATRFTVKHPVSGIEVTVPGRSGDNAMLPSGWTTTPAGRSLASGDMILSGQVSPDGSLFAFTNTGYTRHALHIVDLATEKEIATIPIDRAWSGLAFSPDGRRIYVSAGAANSVRDIHYYERWDKEGWKDGRGGYALRGAVKASTAVSSITLSPDGRLLYALNNSDEHLYILETHGGRAVARIRVGNHPIAARLSSDGRTLYVANLGSANVAIVDVSDPSAPRVTAALSTDPHPNDVVLTDDGRLFVSCGNTNNVVAFDVRTRERLEVISTALGPQAPAGSTPNSLALSPDGTRLYVANADNNSVSVVDVQDRRRSRPLGFVPTGWYPTLVTTTKDGKRLIVASSKGVGTGPNRVKRPIDPIAPAGGFQHHGHNMNGLLSFVDVPDGKTLSRYSAQVYENTRYRDALLATTGVPEGSVIPTRVGDPTPIRHVLFIMKENRTYDQVFGDLPQGNGDPSLTLFGRDVTPNQHALAEQFVLLDNLYCSGEVSQDGWPWTLSAYVTEFNQRAWTLGYSGHGNLNTSGTTTQQVAPESRDEGDHVRQTATGITEQSTPYLWELALAHALKVKTFGVYNRRGVDPVASRRFDPAGASAPRDRDTARAERFVAEFREMEQAGTVPSLMVMSLGEDHTAGTTPGAFTPKAQVASNDVAVGTIVEAITKSSLWSKFAIFVIEDDAQNGPDHVDSHRTIGLVISPYVKRKVVDSTMYSTVSMLRTMELLLGLPPMTQHDAAAQPMVNSFMTKPDLSGFTALPARIDLTERNASHAYGAAQAARMDFRDYDRIDEDALNRILWHSIKGADAAYPVPVRRALPTPYGFLSFPVADRDDD
jgi:YVTN family beta-propeller protein